MGTTKLTRKEILSDDPVQEAMIRLVEFFRKNGMWIVVAAAALVVLGIAAYAGLDYLDSRELQAQRQLAKGMDFYHAQVSADAPDDPYGAGPTPAFKSEEAKYQAAAKEFSSVASQRGHAKISIIARYYLGLTQLQIGEEKDAIRNLESVSGNSRNRTVGFLAKKALASYYFKSGNYGEAGKLLDSIIKDSQCDLPKDDLNLMLAKALAAQGKREEAIMILTEATSQGLATGILRQQMAEELEELQNTDIKKSEPESAVP